MVFAEFNEHLDAELRIAKDGPYVETLEMRSRAPFSPAFSFKVKEFTLVLRFAPADGSEVVLLQSAVRSERQDELGRFLW